MKSMPPSPPEAMLADSNNEFALDLYKKLSEASGNLFFSALSVRMVLGLACAGAREKTAAEMRKALRLPDSGNEYLQTSALMGERLQSGEGHQLTVANALWNQEGAPLAPEYQEAVSSHFPDAMRRIDFRDAEAARAVINQWVSGETKGRIQGLLSPGAVDDLTRFVLVNAIHFKGRWEDPFREHKTNDQPFYLEDGGTVSVPLMHREIRIRYGKAKGLHAIDLDYQGGDLSMLVLLPDKKKKLRKLEEKLSTGMLSTLVDKMVETHVEVYLPQFSMTFGAVNLGGQLQSLGMRRAFSQPEADFSGINGFRSPSPEALYIAGVFHKAFLNVDEKGTEAAAATATILVGSLMVVDAPIFRADHPFLFAIRDRATGTILFLGRVMDPTRESE